MTIAVSRLVNAGISGRHKIELMATTKRSCPDAYFHLYRNQVNAIIVLRVILLIAGFLLKISPLWTIGVVLLIIGLVLMVMGRAGHAVGGRRHYY